MDLEEIKKAHEDFHLERPIVPCNTCLLIKEVDDLVRENEYLKGHAAGLAQLVRDCGATTGELRRENEHLKYLLRIL